MQYRNYNNGSNYFWLALLIFFMFGGFRTLFFIIPLFFLLIPGIIFLFVFFKIISAISSNSNIQSQSQARLHYVELIVHIMVGAMKADGHIDQRELQAIQLFFQQRLRFNYGQMRWIQDLLQHSVNSNISLDDVCATFNSEYGEDEKRLCCELLFEVVAADEKITKEEQAYVDQVIRLLGISNEYASQLKKKYYSDTATKSNYEILGVDDNAPFDLVKKAYRNLSKKYHPDKVQYLGDEFKDFSDQKIKEINAAYESIKKAQGK